MLHIRAHILSYSREENDPILIPIYTSKPLSKLHSSGATKLETDHRAIPIEAGEVVEQSHLTCGNSEQRNLWGNLDDGV